VTCNLPHTRASDARAYMAGKGTVSVEPCRYGNRLEQRERLQGTQVPRGKRLPDDEAFASMKRRGLVWSRTHEKKRLYSVRNIIKGTNVLGHSMCKVPNAYRAHQGILGATEKIGNDDHWAMTLHNPPSHPTRQKPPQRVILGNYNYFCGALLVPLRSKTYRFRTMPPPHIFTGSWAVAGRAWEGEWLVRRTSEAMPVCINHQFKPISHSQLGKDGCEVVPYRRLADAQALGDLLIP
jgi:hypothetical protein